MLLLQLQVVLLFFHGYCSCCSPQIDELICPAGPQHSPCYCYCARSVTAARLLLPVLHHITAGDAYRAQAAVLDQLMSSSDPLDTSNAHATAMLPLLLLLQLLHCW
eukprot:GHUV01025468.1.p3 GENE.GHUV01025468.1~~GHUV01025468.1.p3  ORF type:complete len:106 (-),score=31.64 GHUV01025468.1:1700-2017(-)